MSEAPLTILVFSNAGLCRLLYAAKRYPWQFALIAALALCWWFWSGKTDVLSQRDVAKTELTTARVDWAK